MERLFVTADDRTGALETAGALADRRGRPVRMLPLAAGSARAPHGDGCVHDVVVDLGSRHVDHREVERLVAAALDRIDASVTAHKFDSALRGNWATELVALHRRTGKRVLVVPALPSVGRVCRAGVVLVDGVPVTRTAVGLDPRRPVGSSRPAEHLVAAGAAAVAALSGGAELASWVRERGPAFAVIDAVSDDDLRHIGDVWRADASGVLLAGTSAAISFGVSGSSAGQAGPVAASVVPAARAVLVVCGSLHPVARRQIAALMRWADADDRVAIAITPPPWPHAATVDDTVAAEMRAALAERAVQALRADPERVAVVLGGDTAAALLGDDILEVGGTLGSGSSWSHAMTADRLVVTRAGGFGDDLALVRMVGRLLEHGEAAAATDRPGTL